MRKNRILGIAAATALLLAGCSAPEPAPEASPAPTPPPEKVTMMVSSDREIDLSSPVMQALQEHFGIRLSLSVCDPTQYTGRLQVALTSNEAFDLIETTPVLANAYRSRLQDARPILSAHAPSYLETAAGYGLWEDVDHRLSCIPTRIVERSCDTVWFIRKDLDAVPAPGQWPAIPSGELGLSIPGGTEGMMRALTPLWGSAWAMETAECGYASDAAYAALEAAGSLAARGILDPDQAVRTHASWQELVRTGRVAVTAAGRADWDLLWQAGYRMTEPPAWGTDAALPPDDSDARQWCSIPAAAVNPEGAARLLEKCFSAEGKRLINLGIEGVHHTATVLENGSTVSQPLSPYDEAGIWQATAQGIAPPILPGHLYAEDIWLSNSEFAEYETAAHTVLPDTAVLSPRNPASAQRAQQLEIALLGIRQRMAEDVLRQGACTDAQWQRYVDDLSAAGLEEAMGIYGIAP